MTKQIRLNAFTMNYVAHQSPGLWTHPRDRTIDFAACRTGSSSRRRSRRGRFDRLFLADVLGVAMFRGSPDAALLQRRADAGERTADADPGDGRGDRHLGFGVTPATCRSGHYPFAQRMSTAAPIISPEGRIGLERGHRLSSTAPRWRKLARNKRDRA